MSAAALAAILRDPLHAATGDVSLERSLLEEAEAHGVTALLYLALRDAGTLATHPADVQRTLGRAAREAALVDDIRRTDARRVVNAFAAGGIVAIVFKGAALAHTHYPEPWTRPHVDVDLWVDVSDAGRAARLLDSLGYRRTARPTGEHVTHQCTYVSTVGGVQVAYDLHWRLADPEAFADVIGFNEAASASVALSALGANARALGPVHALIVSCVHRVAHHYDDDQLLRLSDIDRLARGLNEAQWMQFGDLAAARRVCAVCVRGLDLAADAFATPVPAVLIQALRAGAHDEPSAVYLRNRMRKVDILRSDLLALSGWRARLRLIREHLFPPAEYMLAVNPGGRGTWLPAKYAWRIARGAWAWFRPLR